MSKYYFKNKEAEMCYTLDHFYDFMVLMDIKEMEVYEAKVEKVEGYFWCKHYDTMGEDGECGNHCDGYIARNGVKGICVHRGNLYEATDLTKTLKLKK